jgi:choline kinase
MYSAYLAKETFMGEPFYMMNADVFFHSSVIAELAKDKYTSILAYSYKEGEIKEFAEELSARVAADLKCGE